jgi:uncharacterized protein
MTHFPAILGLLDTRAGHAAQVSGLTEALHGRYFCDAETIELDYNRLAYLPNLLLGSTTMHLNGQVRQQLSDILSAHPAPIVIACGRRSEPVARAIKRKYPRSRIVYLMTPSRLSGWDALVIPEHDLPRSADSRIITTLTPLHRITPELLADERPRWEVQFASVPAPRIGVLLGDVSPDIARAMITAAKKLCAEQGGLLITTSRRTLSGLLPAVLRDVTVPYSAFDWHHPVGDNPYLGILAHADALVVSGDSLAMCAEACASGVCVFIAQDSSLPTKHRALHQQLFARGVARPLERHVQGLWARAAMENETERAASQLAEKLAIAMQ